MTECKNCLEEISEDDYESTEEYCGQCVEAFREDTHVNFREHYSDLD